MSGWKMSGWKSISVAADGLIDGEIVDGDAAESSLRFLEVASYSTTFPVWAAMYLSPIHDMFDIPCVIWLQGASGAMKSTLVALALNHFGEQFDHSSMPTSGHTTHQEWLAQWESLTDRPMVIDDVLDMAEAARFVEAAVNQVGRVPVIITSEYECPVIHPYLHLVEIARCNVDNYLLTELQESRGALRKAMAGYQVWVSNNREQIQLWLGQTDRAFVPLEAANGLGSFYLYACIVLEEKPVESE